MGFFLVFSHTFQLQFGYHIRIENSRSPTFHQATKQKEYMNELELYIKPIDIFNEQ